MEYDVDPITGIPTGQWQSVARTASGYLPQPPLITTKNAQVVKIAPADLWVCEYCGGTNPHKRRGDVLAQCPRCGGNRNEDIVLMVVNQNAPAWELRHELREAFA